LTLLVPQLRPYCRFAVLVDTVLLHLNPQGYVHNVRESWYGRRMAVEWLVYVRELAGGGVERGVIV
jgi:hypothetical protein